MNVQPRLWRIAGILLMMIGPASAGPIEQAPRRVVSMNLCTDQLAILDARPGQLHSVSYLAKRPDERDKRHARVGDQPFGGRNFAGDKRAPSWWQPRFM